VPFTFFAHQAPLLPIVRRWPERVDGIALMIGTMSPDFAYVLNGTRLQVWAHAFPALALFCLPVTVIVSWFIARVLAPVVPAHLPSLGEFHLRDWRGLATHKFSLGKTLTCAQIGAISHVFFDHFTHPWGWFAENVSWARTVIFKGVTGSGDWMVFDLLQFVGHTIGTFAAVVLLWKYGKGRWMQDRAAACEPMTTSFRTYLYLWIPALMGMAAGAFRASGNLTDIAAGVMDVAGGAFVGLVLGAVVVRK
jgi:Domain of unknown function (DUF4184)